MRVLSCLVLLCLLAGCADDPAPTVASDVEQPPAAVPLKPVVLVDELVMWHELDSQPLFAVLTVYDIVTQVAVHPCIFEGEPYFSNRQLQTDFRDVVQPGAGVLRTTLSWGPTDYVGDGLRLAYRSPGATEYDVTPVIANGQTLDAPLTIPEPLDGGDAGRWSLWLCLDNDTGDSVRAVPGAIQTRIDWIPDESTAGATVTA